MKTKITAVSLTLNVINGINISILKKIFSILTFFLFFSEADFIYSKHLFPFKERNNPGDIQTSPDKVIIARIAGRIITLKDFIERTEYSIRPPFCRGSSNNDKNIILNNLIAEKLLAHEAEQKRGLFAEERFLNFVSGRKEQRMRDLLYYYEGEKNVVLDSAEIINVFSAAGRTYGIQYLNLKDKKLADSLAEEWEIQDTVFNSALKNFASVDSIPEREISWNSQEIPKVHKALFSDRLQQGEIIGPLSIDDTTHLIIKIKRWSDKLAVSGTDFTRRWTDVVERLTRIKADSIYDKFVLEVMGNRRLNFNADVFNKLVTVLAPYYLNQKNAEVVNKFLADNENPELPDPKTLGSGYFEIKDYPIIKIDDKTWSVADLKKEIDKHPLVFRRDTSNYSFAAQLRLAIVDLVRDKYLTDMAYKRGYHETEIVKHYEQTWADASIALFMCDEYLKKINIKNNNTEEIIENYLNPFIKELLKNYSDQIEINVEEYNKIQLTRIDMFVTQTDVPYPVYVPAFPALTNHNRLNFGKKMEDVNSLSHNKK